MHCLFRTFCFAFRDVTISWHLNAWQFVRYLWLQNPKLRTFVYSIQSWHGTCSNGWGFFLAQFGKRSSGDDALGYGHICAVRMPARVIARLFSRHYVKSSLVHTAWAAVNHRKCSFSRWFWSHQGHLGRKKAIIAVARKMLSLIYTLLQSGEFYDSNRGLLIPLGDNGWPHFTILISCFQAFWVCFVCFTLFDIYFHTNRPPTK